MTSLDNFVHHQIIRVIEFQIYYLWKFEYYNANDRDTFILNPFYLIIQLL